MIGKYFTVSSFYVDILGDLDAGNISYCPGGNEWIMTHFGQCVSDASQWASFIVGFVSLVIWFLPSLPQIYQNYKSGSCEEALSPIFLFLWFFGDAMNLTGAVLTKQLPLQIDVSGYYIIQDCIILGQYVYYKVKNRRKVQFQKDFDPPSEPRVAVLNSVILGGVLFVSGSAFYSKSGAFFKNNRLDGGYRSRTLLAPIFNGAKDELGYACGSLSALSYLIGRFPQLVKNYKRQSTKGVSIAMYFLICLGNATYGASVLLGCDGDPWIYYARHLPWLVGSFGCLLLDSLVFVQYFRYKGIEKDEPLLASIDDRSEQSHLITDPSV